jgi:hypothetical protein
MGKIKIQGSVYSDTDLTDDVCSHLKPVLEFLVSKGNTYAKGPLETSKDGGRTRHMSGPIDFDAVEQWFDVPSFIKLAREHHGILCTRCWCDIVGK